MLQVAVMIGLALAAPVAAIAGGGVYIAGQGSSLAQALGQALADNPRKSGGPFWVIVTGTEITRLTKSGTSADMQGELRNAFERGAEVYACRSDMTRHGIKDEDLVDGVVPMYGYGQQDWSGLLPARKERIALPLDMTQSQRILKTCAGEPKPGT